MQPGALVARSSDSVAVFMIRTRMPAHVIRALIVTFIGLACVGFAAVYAADLPARERPGAWLGFVAAAVVGAALGPVVRLLDRRASGTALGGLLASQPVQTGVVVAGVVAAGLLVHVLGPATVMMIEGFFGALMVSTAFAYGRFHADD